MPNYVGSGPGGAIQPGVDPWNPTKAELIRQDLVDHETELADHEARLDANRFTVRAATTASITIATALNNGDTLDGVTLATGNFVLVKNQAAPEQNGVYLVGVSPARSTEFATYNAHPGALITVQEGTTNADTLWLCTSNVGGTLNTTAIAFAAFVGGTGITELTTDVVAGPGSGTQTATIANDAVSNTKLANMATQTIKGRTTGGTGDPEDLTATQATAILNAMVGDSGSGGTKGLAPAPGSGDAAAGKYLKADGTYQVPPGTGGSTTRQLTFIFDGGGSVISTGEKDTVRISVTGTITRWVMLSLDGTTGSIVVDLWKDTYANYPPTVADTITGSEKPTISSAIKAEDASPFSGGTTSVTAGELLKAKVDSVTSMTKVALFVEITT
jgi:hypothetical protein